MTDRPDDQPPDLRRYAPAVARNRAPILEVLRRVLPPQGCVLEIASGTGEHAAFFAPRLAPRQWQPSEAGADALPGIEAWRRHAGASNLRPAIVLDAGAPVWPVESAAWDGPPISAITAINLVHISPWRTCQGLMAGAGRLLGPGGVLYLYGPYRLDGAHTAPSNAEFDRSLRARNPAWGVRERDAVSAEAARHGLRRTDWVAMPANNFSLVFEKS